MTGSTHDLAPKSESNVLSVQMPDAVVEVALYGVDEAALATSIVSVHDHASAGMFEVKGRGMPNPPKPDRLKLPESRHRPAPSLGVPP